MPYTYPPAAPTISGDLVTISRFLNDPTLIARRLRTLAEQRFIADALLTQRFTTTSGSAQYETSESVFADRDPEGVNPGSEYPLTTISSGVAQLAKTVKWGEDAEITDESISRQKMDPVNRGITKLVNSMVKTVDGVALSVIASTVTQSTAATGSSWSSGTPTILRDILKAKANIIALNQGYDPDTVVLDDLTWAIVMSDPAISALLPRENGSAPVLTGDFPVIAGLRFLATPNLPTAGNALVLDSKALGGMVDENLAGPGYTSAFAGVQAKSIRKDDNDLWRLRVRRVTVPVVLEPAAAWKITSV